jgi:hypothetical protein
MLNILRLCVGCESLDDLRSWQSTELPPLPPPWQEHIFTLTTMYPKRADEIAGQGSLYWVIKGRIAVRQGIVQIDKVSTTDGGTRTRLILRREWIETVPVPCRPFQGWRYLEPERAPPDIGSAGAPPPDMPPELAAELRTLGLI